MITTVIDFDLATDKKRLFGILQGLKGKNAIEIKKWRKKRSNRENNYYWGVIVKIISDSTGFFPDEVHDLLKRKFLAFEKGNRITGEVELFCRSTTDLDTAEAESFYEQVRVWSLSELSIYIPLPGEMIYQ